MDLELEPICAEGLTCHLGCENSLFSVSYAGCVRKKLDVRMCNVAEHVIFLVCEFNSFHCKSHHFGA